MQSVTTKYGQNLLDISIKEVGNIAALFAIAQKNDLAITADLPSGMLLDVDITGLFNTEENNDTAILPDVKNEAEILVINSKELQTLLDISIQEKGSVEALFAIALRNEKSITDELASGSVIDVNTKIIDEGIAAYYFINKLKPSSNASAIPGVEVEEGIEFWAVEYEFIVS